MTTTSALNVYEEPLQACCFEPMTGWYRDGYCHTDDTDHGIHTVCVIVTQEFLEFSKSVGNDLSTPSPWFHGLKSGDKWCLCAARWQEAAAAGAAPKVFMDATNFKTLETVSFEELESHSLFQPRR